MITLAYVRTSPSYVFENKMREISGVSEVQCICITENDLAAGYNEVLNSATYDVVVFLHNDVEICSENWAKDVLQTFSTSSYGILGTVGTIAAPLCGMLWEKEEPICGKIWYESYSENNKNVFSEGFKNPIDVVAVEGSFIAVHQDRIKARFDTDFKGDSFFDSDFCIENFKRGASIAVVSTVDILKSTFDEQDETFYENRELFEEKQNEKPTRIIPEIVVDQENVELTDYPSISVIIENKGNVSQLFSCLESIYEKTSYLSYSITIIDTGSTKEELEEILHFTRTHGNTKLIKSKNPHLSMMFNQVSQQKESDLLLFFSKNIVLVNDAISHMVDVYNKNKDICGTVGMRIHQKMHMVRSFGLALSSMEIEDEYELGVEYKGYGKAFSYVNETVSEVTGNSMEALLIDRELFIENCGFNEQYVHSLQDFELNLSLIVQGKSNFLAGKACGIYMGMDKPKYLPTDFVRLVEFINENIEQISPYVNLVNVV